MGQFAYNANEHNLGVTLSSLGFTAYTGDPTADFTVVQVAATGRKMWELSSGTNATASMGNSASTGPGLPLELLCFQDFTADEISASHGGVGLGIIGNNGFLSTGSYEAVVQASNDAMTVTIPTQSINSTQKNVAATGFTGGSATALRISINDKAFKAKAWQAAVGGLVAGEPGVWDYEATLQFGQGATTYGVTRHSAVITDPLRFTAITVGTDGDAAPYELIVPTVATPTNLSVSNISSTTVDTDWD